MNLGVDASNAGARVLEVVETELPVLADYFRRAAERVANTPQARLLSVVEGVEATGLAEGATALEAVEALEAAEAVEWVGMAATEIVGSAAAAGPLALLAATGALAAFAGAFYVGWRLSERADPKPLKLLEPVLHEEAPRAPPVVVPGEVRPPGRDSVWADPLAQQWLRRLSQGENTPGDQQAFHAYIVQSQVKLANRDLHGEPAKTSLELKDPMQWIELDHRRVGISGNTVMHGVQVWDLPARLSASYASRSLDTPMTRRAKDLTDRLGVDTDKEKVLFEIIELSGQALLDASKPGNTDAGADDLAEAAKKLMASAQTRLCVSNIGGSPYFMLPRDFTEALRDRVNWDMVPLEDATRFLIDVFTDGFAMEPAQVRNTLNAVFGHSPETGLLDARKAFKDEFYAEKTGRPVPSFESISELLARVCKHQKTR